MCMSSINLLDTTNVQRTPFATPSLVPSILINVILSSLINLSSLPQNAAFIAKSLGIDMVDSVTAALSAAGFSNQTTKEVLIRSTDSAVLVKLKQQETECKLVYTLPLGIGDASKPSLKDIKAFAEAVVVDRTSVFALSYDFIMGQNRIVRDLQAAGLAVYAQVFRNEYVAHPFDFLGDPTVEINYYVQTFNLSGMITDFPKTVRRYKGN
jgi:glycerophosphoryl diester phosphodiesterase